MGLTIARADVKRKCRISVTDFDSDIDTLVAEMKPAIEYAIADRFLADTGSTGLQATLNLGALEIVCGEFLAQLLREEGASEQMTVGDITIGDRPQRNRLIDLADPYGLQRQGWTRLRPYLKRHVTLQLRASSAKFTDEEKEQW